MKIQNEFIIYLNPKIMADINLNEKKSQSQCDMIADWLAQGYSLTSLDALKLFNCMRLASRICDLRDRGLEITTCRIKTPTGKYVTEYSLKR